MKMKDRGQKMKDQYTVVLEDLRSQFRVFGEGLSLVGGEVKKTSGKLDKMETDLEMIKAELALIRHNQVSRDEFKFLETRVARLERRIK